MTDEQLQQMAEEANPHVTDTDNYDFMDRMDINQEIDAVRRGYIQGFKACQSQDRWIPVTERLPEIGQHVLVARSMPRHRVMKDRYTDFGHLGKDFKYNAVTHWQPIPNPPTSPGIEP